MTPFKVPGLYAALDAYIHANPDAMIITEGGTARQLGDSPLYAHYVWMGADTIIVNLGAPDCGGIVMVGDDDIVSPATDF